MKMRIVRDAVCARCGAAPAFERWSVSRVLKSVKRWVLCGRHGKGLAKMRPRTPG